jgi:DNA-binding SARP family transcriptional activator
VGTPLAMLWLLHQLVRSSHPRSRRRSPRLDRTRLATQSPAPTAPQRFVQPGPTIARAATPVLPKNGLNIRCFGRFEVERDGKPITDWHRAKARSLLKFLVAHGRPVPRDVLVELLWPQSDVQPARNSLRVTLHALRQALGSVNAGNSFAADVVAMIGGNYLLNPDVVVWIDVDEFELQFEAGVRLERQHRLAESIQAFEQAESLYRDDFLVEDLYEDWAVARRERLKDQYLLLVTRLADYCLKQGDFFGCIVRCHKILQKDACREDAYVRLMRCYVALGQTSQALHWFEICAQTLRKELDVGPSEVIERLRARIAPRHAESRGIVRVERERA